MPTGANRMQLAIDRLNHACGFNGWGYTVKVLHQRAGVIKGSGTAYEITAGVQIWVGHPSIFRIGFGGDMAGVQSQALQAATQTAFLNAAAMFGIGREWLEWRTEATALPITGGNTPMQEIPAEGFSGGGLEQIFATPSSQVLESLASSAQPTATPPSPPPAPQDRESMKRLAAEDGAPPGSASSATPSRPAEPMMTPQQATTIRQLCAVTGKDAEGFFKTNPTQARAANAITSLTSAAQAVTGPGAPPIVNNPGRGPF